MSRPIRCRRIERLPVFRSFSPDDVAAEEQVGMTVDEFETIRLLDNEGLTQEACAARMNIARTTVTAIYDSARKKLADRRQRGSFRMDCTHAQRTQQTHKTSSCLCKSMCAALPWWVLSNST